MKTINLLFVTAFLCLTFSFTANAQSETKLGALLAYGTEVESIGIGANAEFPIVEKLTISPSLAGKGFGFGFRELHTSIYLV